MAAGIARPTPSLSSELKSMCIWDWDNPSDVSADGVSTSCCCYHGTFDADDS